MDKLQTLNYLLNTDYKTLGEAQQDLLTPTHLDSMNNPSMYYIYFMENVVQRYNNIVNVNEVLRFVNDIENSLEHRYMLGNSTLKTLGYTVHKLIDTLSGYNIKSYERGLPNKIKNSKRFKGVETTKHYLYCKVKPYNDKVELLHEYLYDKVFTDKAQDLLDNYKTTKMAVTNDEYIFDLTITQTVLMQFILDLSRLKEDETDTVRYKQKPFNEKQKEQMLRLLNNRRPFGYKNYINDTTSVIENYADEFFTHYYTYIKAVNDNDKLLADSTKEIITNYEPRLHAYIESTLESDNIRLFSKLCALYSNNKTIRAY